MRNKAQIVEFLRPKIRYPKLADALENGKLDPEVEADVIKVLGALLEVEDEAMRKQHDPVGAELAGSR